jgi:hypothetical protein
MIAPLSPTHGLITVASIEAELITLGCIKVVTNKGATHTSLWRAPNGRHFHAPNPDVYSKVPADTLPRVLKRYADVMNLPPPN